MMQDFFLYATKKVLFTAGFSYSSCPEKSEAKNSNELLSGCIHWKNATGPSSTDLASVLELFKFIAMGGFPSSGRRSFQKFFFRRFHRKKKKYEFSRAWYRRGRAGCDRPSGEKLACFPCLTLFRIITRGEFSGTLLTRGQAKHYRFSAV